MEPFEKLGQFYLGKLFDHKQGEVTDDLLLYDSKDLTTHAVCVGMTGSGKTGLCVSLLEEAALDGIPAIVIDPKGDLANLCLQFPELNAEAFTPWVNEDQARRKGKSKEEYAKDQSELWENGLKKWGQGKERLQRLQQAAEVRIYTPGSDAGLPISILSSFAAPPKEIIQEAELLAERCSTTVSSLLGLLGIEADPIRSKEHILLSTILQNAWLKGISLDLAGLIQKIQEPGVTRIGVMELEGFYPAKERFELAMAINSLLASPQFAGWMQGEALDIDSLLFSDKGKPRLVIFSIAHLSDPERMFFVSLLLNQFLGWMRSKPGSSSLRALLYMDEIFGFIPPVANPPSKKPLMTLLKQARAFGVGCVLATQNPVDLDYKGLSNTGTWFIGRLQTEQDKERLIEGLKGLTSGDQAIPAGEIERMISQLDKRVFLLHNVHERGPVLFHTRWAMSYLAGPVTRTQIRKLMEPFKVAFQEKAKVKTETKEAESSCPVLAPGIPQVFLAPENGEEFDYRPVLLGMADVFYTKGAKGAPQKERVVLMADLQQDPEWADAVEGLEDVEDRMERTQVNGAGFLPLCKRASSEKSYKKWERAFVQFLYREKSIEMFESKTYKLSSDPGESERDFRIRLQDVAREVRDRESERLRQKYATKFKRLEAKILRAEQKVQKQQEDASSSKVQSAISFGATLLSAFLGRKATSLGTLGRATTAARSVSRGRKKAGDVKRAKASLEQLLADREELNVAFEEELEKLEDKFDPELEEFKTKQLKPRKSDIEVRRFTLAWVPEGN